MVKPFRVLDTGVIEGRLNIAIGQALVESRQAGKSPDTLRFLRFPPTALIGRHQALKQEIDLDYCRRNDIGVVRRITGGGAIYLDPGQLGWELVFNRATLGISSLAGLAQEICSAVASGLSSLGIAARYRPRNDIEVDGRKISGTGGFFDQDTLFYQGTVLVDMNPEVMVAALRVPQAKLAKRNLESAAQRIVTLKELLGDEAPGLDRVREALAGGLADWFGLDLQPGELGQSEHALAGQFYEEEIGRDDFVAEIDEPAKALGTLAGQHTSPGGTITSYLRVEGPAQNRIRAALITGDFFVAPPRLIYDLEASLRNVSFEDAGDAVRSFFQSASIEVLSVSPDDFVASIDKALSGTAPAAGPEG
jgi:lipoate-protein ligase A